MRRSRSPHPVRVGDVTTVNVLARLVEIGGTVLIPFSENQRYDLLVETPSGAFKRIQCKTGRLRDGAVRFALCSVAYHPWTRQPERPKFSDYRGEADFFGVYCPETDEVYLVPVDVVGRRLAALRVDPPSNGQRRHIRWAEDHVLRTITMLDDQPSFGQEGRLFEPKARYSVRCSPG